MYNHITINASKSVLTYCGYKIWFSSTFTYSYISQYFVTDHHEIERYHWSHLQYTLFRCYNPLNVRGCISQHRILTVLELLCVMYAHNNQVESTMTEIISMRISFLYTLHLFHKAFTFIIIHLHCIQWPVLTAYMCCSPWIKGQWKEN